MSETDVGPRFRPLPVLIIATLALIAAFLPLGLEPRAQRALVILVAAAGLWITEAIPIPATAILVPVLGLSLGLAEAKALFAPFGDPIVFMFLGTFLLTDAAERHGLNARLARHVLARPGVRAHPGRLLWAVALLGCLISAWVNNTATTAMILPLALTAERFGSHRLLVAVLLMASYAPSLGGVATPVGTAPNLIGLRLLEQATQQRPSFAAWCAMMAPLAILATVLTTFWLHMRARDASAVAPPVDTSAPRPWSLAERLLVPLFVLVILMWITPGMLAATPLRDTEIYKLLQARLPEAAVPLFGGLLLFVLPAGDGGRILDGGVFRRIDWGTLLLFGGGLTLGMLMFESGLAKALGEAIFRAMPASGTFGVVLAATLMAVAVSELTSNTASASLVVPVVIELARAAGVEPTAPVLAATVACSFGFMLPVSTPPNALVYATGRLRIREMVAAGVLLDIGGVALIATWFTWVV